MTTLELTAKAITKLSKRTLAEVHRYIDEQLPLPSCVNERGVVLLKRKRVKENLEAAMRQTKVTGPSLTKDLFKEEKERISKMPQSERQAITNECVKNFNEGSA